MIDVDNIINLLRESIEEEDWRIVEQVVEMLNVEIDNPFDEYVKDEDIEEYSFEDIVEEADMYSCCGDVLDQDRMMCPSCKEHN